jgi:hypothetical protein
MAAGATERTTRGGGRRAPAALSSPKAAASAAVTSGMTTYIETSDRIRSRGLAGESRNLLRAGLESQGDR